MSDEFIADINILGLRHLSSANIITSAEEHDSMDIAIFLEKEGIETPSRLTALPDSEAFVDPGLPIPDSYDTDIISALVQDPFRLYVYWEVRSETVNSINNIFSPEELSTFSPVLRIMEKKTGAAKYYPVKYPGADWFQVSPDKTYIVEFGVYSDHLGFIRLLTAPEVSTPRGTVAVEVALEPEYNINSFHFKKILESAGFSRDIQSTSEEPLLQSLSPDLALIFQHAAMDNFWNETQLNLLPSTVRDIVIQLIQNEEKDIALLSLLHYLPGILRDKYLKYLINQGIIVELQNTNFDSEEIEQLEWLEDLEFEELVDEEEFFIPGILRFGIGSSAGSDLGSLRGRKLNRIRRKIPRKRHFLSTKEHPVPTYWLPSMNNVKWLPSMNSSFSII